MLGLYVVGLPIAWPLDVMRRTFCRRRHEALQRRIARGETGVAEVERGEALAATISTRVTTTMASGPEEETCVLLSLRDGSERVVPWSRDLEQAIGACGIQTARREFAELGIAALFGWGGWLAACLVLAGAWASSWAPIVAALVVLAALVALGLS